MKLKSWSAWLLPVVLAGLCGTLQGGFFKRPAVERNGLASNLKPAWMQNAYWFDGRAELNYYDAVIGKYGHPRRTHEVFHILVTEKHKRDLLVKADDWRAADLVDMLKFNYVCNAQTGIYKYYEMMSLFFNQADLRFAKMTFGSQEWCGNAFKEIVNFGGRSSFTFNTYWDGQGNGRYPVRFPRDMVPYEALPVQLRMVRLEAGTSFTVALLPPQMSSRAAAPEIRPAQVHIEATQSVGVPAGTFETHRISVTHATGTDRLWFETAFPHRMVKWEQASGDRYELRASKKLAYWELNRPGDECHLE